MNVGSCRTEGRALETQDKLTGYQELDPVLMICLVQHLLAGVVAFILRTQLCDAQRAVVNQGEADIRGEGDP